MYDAGSAPVHHDLLRSGLKRFMPRKNRVRPFHFRKVVSIKKFAEIDKIPGEFPIFGLDNEIPC